MKWHTSILLAFVISACLFYGCTQVSSAKETTESSFDGPLKNLEWLIGTWVDSDATDNVEVFYTYTWGSNHHFIIQNFKGSITDESTFEGYQIIGWDPIRKGVRSWVFDNEGGFGGGYWTLDDQTWYVNMKFTLADGRRASSTNIYTKVNDTAYRFSSVNRDVGGELLPNIGPITIVKK